MEIKINGEYIDTFDNAIALTRQFIDPTNLKNAFLGRSNQILIPSTPRNNRILKYPRNINTNSNAFETTSEALSELNGKYYMFTYESDPEGKAEWNLYPCK